MSIWSTTPKPNPPPPPLPHSGKTYHSTLLLLLAHSLPAFPDPAPEPADITEVPSILPPPPHRRTFPSASAPASRARPAPAVRRDSLWWELHGGEVLRVREEVDDLQHDLRLAARLHNRGLEVEGNSRGGIFGGAGSGREETRVLKREWEGAVRGIVALPLRKGSASSTPSIGTPRAPFVPGTGLPTPRSSGTQWFRENVRGSVASNHGLGIALPPVAKGNEGPGGGNKERRSTGVLTPPPSPPMGGRAAAGEEKELPKFEYIPIKVPPLVKYAK